MITNSYFWMVKNWCNSYISILEQMSSTIFNPHDYQQILNRLEQLSSTSSNRWGKMNVNQMLVHCSHQLKLGLGMIKQEALEGSPFMRTGLVKWLVLFVIPWTRGLPTPAKMNVIEQQISVKDFDAEKKVLLDHLDQVQQYPKLLPHPFFGALDEKYWGRLIWKHLDHHLKQFGV